MENQSSNFSPSYSAEPPILAPGLSYASITDKIASIVQTRQTPKGWFLGAAIGASLTAVLTVSIGYLFYMGVGIWGINIPVAWGFAIVNFVWWIGIGHAGTLISAILLLLNQTWRTSINRFAEAMTIFAVMCAGLFPLLHMGRPWFFYWLGPIPNTLGVQPQFRSPLVWDVFAVSTYFTVSFIFWYVGLIPDLATLRDRARGKVGQIIYGVFSMGWRGSARHWSRYETAYLLLAGLATPLVLSVHTVVSFDFASSILPGWHTTIFPPYFVAGAIYSGFAMVLVIAIPLRKYYHLEEFITERHLQNMAKVMLATGLMVAYGYSMEVFFAWYSGDPFERYMMHNRMLGPYGGFYWILILFNILTPQALWSQRIRRKPGAVFLISVAILFGMWLERFVIVIISLHRDYLPSSWGMYAPTIWDYATLAGTLGFFTFMMFLFIRFLPMISISEMRALLTDSQKHAPGGSGKQPL